MKRRLLSLALVLSLLLSLLPSAALSPVLAEEAPDPSQEMAFVEETPAEEAAPEEALVEEASPEETPMEEAPTEEVSPEAAPAEEDPDEEASAIEPPIEELPGESAPGEASPGEASEMGPAPTDEALEPLDEEASLELAALGSAGVQYAGVTYLSQGAFAAMSEAGQEVYVRGVDEITELLDRGVPLYDVVFALYEDGDVAFHFVTPVERFAEAEGAAPPDATPAGPIEEVEPLEEEEPAEVEELIEEMEYVELPEPAPVLHVENVALLEELKEPIVRVRNGARSASALSPAVLMDGELGELEELYAQSKEFFCDQLTPGGQVAFDLAKTCMIDDGETGFDMETRAEVDSDELLDAVSALLNTYPWGFDWSDGYLNYDAYWDAYSGSSEISVSMSVSDYYDDSLEQRAQAKAEDLIEAGLDSARKNYPYDLPYGMVRYFDQWLCAHNYYNTRGMYPSDEWGLGDRVFFYCHSSYGTLLQGYGVCESYAKAMARLLDGAGIPNLYVVGDEHAWNNVQMLNENYYMLDSTWNDKGSNSSRKYLLSGRDSGHKPDGINYDGSMRFDFPTLPKAKYVPSKGPVTLNQDVLYLRKGKSGTLKLTNSAYKNDKKSWKSSDTKVAKVKNGKVTAVGPGSATIALSCAGQTVECQVYVYQVSSLYFEENDSAGLTCEYDFEDELRPQIFWLQVEQKGYLDTAENIDALREHQELSFSSSKESVATVDAWLTGDEIELIVRPEGSGDATIKVGFGGKTATLKFKSRQALKDEWFQLEYEHKVYSGKALKPKVSKTRLAPGDLKFSTSYSQNTNAGRAIVKITGKGNYGSLEKEFTIDLAPFDASKVKIGDAKAVYYNGAAQKASPTIKLGNKKLRAGVDYVLLYDGSVDAPVAAGTYALRFPGNNYAGPFSDGASHSFTIQPTPLSKLKLSLKKTSIKANGAPVTPEALGIHVKYGKREIPASDYTVRFRNRQNELIDAPSAPGTYTVVITPSSQNLTTTGKKQELTKSFKIKD